MEQETQLKQELAYLRDRFWKASSHAVLLTANRAMKAVFSQIRSVSPTDTTVLLTGETGTGKSMLAHLIHQHSTRSDKPFISVHCGAIPDTLLESELFGHEKGAFTGAVKKRLGKFEIASGGTIFLDEIGTLSPSTQIKLLHVLQDKKFQRLGSETEQQSDVRIIAATNARLKELCEKELFRWDLYYRLNVFPIHVPPLRERQEDIAMLAKQILQRLNQFGQKAIDDIDVRPATPPRANKPNANSLVRPACFLAQDHWGHGGRAGHGGSHTEASAHELPSGCSARAPSAGIPLTGPFVTELVLAH